MLMGRVYLIQEAKLIGIPRFKVGATSKDNDNRQRSYGKTRRELIIFKTEIPFLIEKQIKKEFNNRFKLVAGTETFEGNEDKMIEEFDKICKKYNCSEYINPSKVESVLKSKPITKLYTFKNDNYQLTYYYKSDVLTNWDIGMDKTMPEKDMIELAIKNKNFIVTKDGSNGMWYLKGNENNFKNILYFKNKLENDGKKRNGLYSILIEKIL